MTISRVLNEEDIFAYSPIRKPLLTPRHINLRYDASKIWLGLSDNEIKTLSSVINANLILDIPIEK